MSWKDDDLDLALRDLRDEALPVAALAEVRSRVLAEVRPRARWWRWVWVPALAAALAVVALVPLRQTPIEPPPLVAKAPSAPPISRPAARPAPVRVKPPAPKPETQFARILTEDPNVVILWAMNNEGATK